MREIGVRGKLPTLVMDNAAGAALVKLLSSFHEDLRQRGLIQVS